MVRSAGKNGRTRRSGGRGRAGRSACVDAAACPEQCVSGEESGAAKTEPSVTVETSEAAPAMPLCEANVGTPADEAGEPDARTEGDGVAVSGEQCPRELDMLRGEIFSEELEQLAVEQMFRWMKERGSGQEEREESGAELSGSALLEAVHHGRHVAELALSLFDALSSRLELDMRWARLLVQAAIWHDLGFAVGGRRRHHKRSMEIIEGNGFLSLAFGLEEADRSMVALLARYHRRAWPSMKHHRFAALAEEDRKALNGAAAVLRIADALDFRHKGAVEELKVSLRRRTVRLVCFGVESCRKECRRAMKKGDLLESLLGERLDVMQGKEGDRHAL